MDLKNCIDKGLIKKTRVNKELAKSLLRTAAAKEIAINSARIDEVTISAYVPMAYDALREVLEAICVLNGYKVISHICTGELVKTLVKEFNFVEFDRFRYARNSINYYGEMIDFPQGKDLIKKMLNMKKQLEKAVKKSLRIQE